MKHEKRNASFRQGRPPSSFLSVTDPHDMHWQSSGHGFTCAQQSQWLRFHARHVAC
jgi:hypothetical protein